ncbi:hypothetical protein LCI18_002678 [Fusarium solani-melongenae]|uniref:Uncharacterized protein n=1 Tax=Fusarium solani subsp. cucurbitae TaxID=2747967 RepID=A0ACD3YV51_FUSSC|nr:hypothetical protein LCI18_002678 [Fusarium solani-melongenae]
MPPPPSPPLPSRGSYSTQKTKGLDRLKEMRNKDRTQALYSDSPPPPKQPAPYPKGDVIHHIQDRYVVRHGSYVTKYTKSPYGMGVDDDTNEAVALRFVKTYTTIPVPEVISSDWDRITMEYVEGETLKQAWPGLTDDQRSGILTQLREYISQMRPLGGIYLGRLDGQGVVVPSIMTRSGGPFATTAEFHDWFVKPPKRLNAQSMYWHQITTQLAVESPIVFTHGDIAARNLLYAGWYPEYWEYVFTLRGMDNIDWETLGCHVPSLFANRHDLEYILVGFIPSLS